MWNGIAALALLTGSPAAAQEAGSAYDLGGAWGEAIAEDVIAMLTTRPCTDAVAIFRQDAAPETLADAMAALALTGFLLGGAAGRGETPAQHWAYIVSACAADPGSPLDALIHPN